MTDFGILVDRIQRLENHIHRIKASAVIGCILLVAITAVGQRRRIVPEGPLPESRAPASTVEAEIRSRHFVLIDERGKERALLTADTAGSVFLVMFDGSGQSRAELSVSPDGPKLVFYDPPGQPRTILGSTTLVPSHVNLNGLVEIAPPS